MLQEHIAAEHEKKFKLCDICGKSFIRKVRLSIHLKNVHKVEINDRNLRLDIYENGEKSKLCDLCGKDFDKPNQLRKHLSKVHKVNEFYENESILIKEKNVTNPSEQIVLPILNITLSNAIQRVMNLSKSRKWTYKCKFCLKIS